MRMRAAADCEHSPARAARLAGPSTRSGDRATSGLRRAAEYGTELRQKHGGPSDKNEDGPPTSDYRTLFFQEGFHLDTRAPKLSRQNLEDINFSRALIRSELPSPTGADLPEEGLGEAWRSE